MEIFCYPRADLRNMRAEIYIAGATIVRSSATRKNATDNEVMISDNRSALGYTVLSRSAGAASVVVEAVSSSELFTAADIDEY